MPSFIVAIKLVLELPKLSTKIRRNIYLRLVDEAIKAFSTNIGQKEEPPQFGKMQL